MSAKYGTNHADPSVDQHDKVLITALTSTTLKID